jgi:hypothetical protein
MMETKIVTIEKVNFTTKWVEFWFKEEHQTVTSDPDSYHESSKAWKLHEIIDEADLVNEVANKGYKGIKIEFELRSSNWELKRVVKESRILTDEELLELPIGIYNRALEYVWKQDKIKKGLSGELKDCEYCKRKRQISCICPDGKAKWARILAEVQAISERDHSDIS